MKPYIYFSNLLRFSKNNNISNLLLQVGFLPYDIESKKHLLELDTFSREFFNYITSNFAKKPYSILEFFKSYYLINFYSDFIQIKELSQTYDRASEKELLNFILGTKKLNFFYKSKDTLQTHKKTYELLNTIRDYSDDLILLIETEKFYITKKHINIVNLFNPLIDPEIFFRLTASIDFKFLLVPGLCDFKLINSIFNNFVNKKVFISSNLDFSFANSDKNLLLLDDSKKDKKIKFNNSLATETNYD